MLIKKTQRTIADSGSRGEVGNGVKLADITVLRMRS